ncbi:MAG: hypothetical protein P0Y53_13525 [Candidatus Pseudobacter hemicellulosilyticus]|uniref:Uncharacterized protein n=1 Tax=Candidatus Pseudobacter hemicellulosilyticus TaxID=3121375 RepID=A0AAJ5WKF0_9BACT|nr:MAG: hypothetical protein P0Y53_13525 [Pseudobacter sp.]
MKKALHLVILLLFLYTAETLISFLLFTGQRVLATSSFPFYKLEAGMDDAIFYTTARLIFYFIIQIALFYWLGDKWKLKNNLLKWMLLNAGTYIVISVLYSFILLPYTQELLLDPLFAILTFTTAISPAVLYWIPYCRRLMTPGSAGHRFQPAH